MFMLSSSEVIYEQENNKNKIHILGLLIKCAEGIHADPKHAWV